MMVFDLDPGAAGRRSSSAAEVALALRELFAQLGLECFPKTSGSKGMQVYVPLEHRQSTYDDDQAVRARARRAAREAATRSWSSRA